MSYLVCERCGGELRLSLPEDEYRCEAQPLEHSVPRQEAEQRWLALARAKAAAASSDSVAFASVLVLWVDLAEQAFRAGDEEAGRQALRDALGESDALMKIEPRAAAREATMAVLGDVAEFGERLQDRALALSAYERVVVLARAACAEAPSDPQLARALSAALNGAGRMTRALGDYVTATRFFEEDLATLRALLDARPDDGEVLCDLAVAHFNMYLVGTEHDDEIGHLRSIERLLTPRSGLELPERAHEVLERAKQQLEIVQAAREAAGPPDRSDPDLVETQDAPKVTAQGSATAASDRRWLIEQVKQALERRYPKAGGGV